MDGNGKRRSEQRELMDENQKWLLLSVLKWIRDMDYKKYIDRLEKSLGIKEKL